MLQKFMNHQIITNLKHHILTIILHVLSIMMVQGCDQKTKRVLSRIFSHGGDYKLQLKLSFRKLYFPI